MYIGIDLGGTNIAAALVDADGVIVKRAGIPTNVKGGTKAVVDRLIKVCGELISKADTMPLSIGIGVPGTVNAEKGEVIFTANLPLSGVNLAHELQEEFGCPVYLGNDANCAALGETVAGGAKGAQHVVLITLGTGLGGGIIIGGRLHTGISGAAGETGHMTIVAGGRQCGCGRKGCWETYASASGLIKTAIGYMETYPGSRLWELCGGDAGNVDGSKVFEAYREGDHAAQLAVGEYIEHLAIGIANLINLLEPEMVCVGGGVSNAWDCLAEPLRAAVDAEKYTRYSEGLPQTRIVKAELGNDAGIIGAAMLGVRE